MKIDMGVFDHMDQGHFPPHELYESRLNIIEKYDQAGFYGYHVAEHHQTTLGVASSPGIFLSSVAQRTKQLKFGPLVYLLPLYNPLRLIDEICMLDHLSKGRFQLGIGPGISAFETAYYGVGHLEAQRMYREAFEVIMAGLTQEVLDHQGEYYRYFNVPMILRPYQDPHPPLWYGAAHPGGAIWPAEANVNIVVNSPRDRARAITDQYRETWTKTHKGGETEMPKIGLVRHVFVGETDEEAQRIAAGPYHTWKLSHVELWRKFHADSTLWPEELDEAMRTDAAIVGSPETVREILEDVMTASGCNYLVGRFGFGDMAHDDLARSVDLFVSDVMPHFQK
ncbi:MAG: LLM class flavin-dependent oxidoreductase [Proteobacteria bacterium]|nr:LLM class flavin-dependent oxidoreductase [Pseudomonadota bacterium]